MNAQLISSHTKNPLATYVYLTGFLIASSCLTHDNSYQNEKTDDYISVVGPAQHYTLENHEKNVYYQENTEINNDSYTDNYNDSLVSSNKKLFTTVNDFYSTLSKSQKNLDDDAFEILMNNIDELYV